MSKCYIKGIASITAQPTTVEDQFLEEIISYQESIFRASDPNYKEFIKPAAMRRMSKAVKMGVTASQMALKQAKIEQPDAIITGTGMGCRQDSEKFLEKILYDDEQYLTPTLFIQSTHNTVGGQIALGLKCKAYNVTYVQSAVSFESAIIDAQLMLDEQPNSNIMVGGIDEIAKTSSRFHILNGDVKKEEIHNLELLSSTTAGTIASEGATFMVIGNENTTNNIAEIVDVEIKYSATVEEIKKDILEFISINDLELTAIDAIVLGNNGDHSFDHYYQELQQTLFKDTEQLYYKHLIGEYHTASAFAYWIGTKIFEYKNVPDVLRLNDKKSQEHKNILIYNHYRGENHSISLLRKC